MEDNTKNNAAAELGRLGGEKTAERGPEYYAEIQAMRKVRAGGRPPNPPKATHIGELKIGNTIIPCAVLEGGTRVISENGLTNALLGSRSGASKRIKRAKREQGALVPLFLAPENLKPFIPDDLMDGPLKPIVYLGGQREITGFNASVLPMVCDIWLRARDAGKLQKQQLDKALKAEMLMRGLAHIGIIALVDEATGYQEVRDRLALQAILDKFLRKEFAAWAKRFPDEFYREMFRLKDWTWKGMKVNRPSIVGKYTNDLVYQRLAPGILRELENRNPKDERGNRKAKHHQWLTEDIGHPALAQHLYAIIGFMRASADWDQFYHSVERAFPKMNTTLTLNFPEKEPVT
jgi:hypothetical protein